VAGKIETQKILIGRKVICDFLKVGKNVFYKLEEEGMPVVKRGGQWVAHKDRLNEYFYQATRLDRKI